MKKNLTNLFIFLLIVSFNSCIKSNKIGLNAFQGKWYNIDGTTKTIEINGNKWIEGDEEFGMMTCQISQYNDSITELKVIENKNTITYFTPGMKNYVKIKLDSPSDVFHFEQTDTTGRAGFNCYFTNNKAKIQPYENKK